jgi:hypothetical protein
MKKYIILIILLSIQILQAQIPAISFWNNTRNSSYTTDDQIHIRCETIDLSGLETEMFYSTQTGWENIEMTNLYGLTYEAIIPALPAETQFCRFRTATDTLVGMMPAFQQNDMFPPENELGLIAEDPVGDNLAPDSQNLDMTGNYFGYSDTRFYAGLTNDIDAFPLDSGGLFPTTFYFYVTTIINPETVLIDSVIYAMIYGDIPLFLDSGLYKIGGTEFSLEAFELIGDIEAEVVNGQLQMACDIGTLTNDENFGEWPNVTNSIGVEMLTAKYSLPAEFLLADLATMSLQFIDKYEIEPIVNTLPQITELNGTNSGIFTCNYFDDNGHFPITAEIVVDGETFQMNPLGFAFSSDVIFESVTGSYGWDEATFHFSDNGYDYVEETIINNSSSDQELLNSNYTLRNYPNPFNPNTTISFELNTTEIDDIYLTIYNLKGQKIKQFSILSNQSSISWNGTNEKDEPVSSGIYLYKLKVNGTDIAKSKCMLLK